MKRVEDNADGMSDTFYLHWWDETAQAFSAENGGEARSGVVAYAREVNGVDGRIVFQDEPLAVEYPGGYKFWRRRDWSEAPDWVRRLRVARSGKRSTPGAACETNRPQTNRPRRHKLLSISPEALYDLLSGSVKVVRGVPRGCKIVRAVYDLNHDEFMMVLENAEFPEVCAGAVLDTLAPVEVQAAGVLDWRIGLTVKPKYRHDPLYYERGDIVEVLPDGTGGIADHTGVLKIKLHTGRTIMVPADHWVTA